MLNNEEFKKVLFVLLILIVYESHLPKVIITYTSDCNKWLALMKITFFDDSEPLAYELNSKRTFFYLKRTLHNHLDGL